MIQSALGNKYRFHMQVSARAISASGEGRAIRKTPGNAAGRAERPPYFDARSRQRVFLDQRFCTFCLIDGQAATITGVLPKIV
jgi:hypothetical protein